MQFVFPETNSVSDPWGVMRIADTDTLYPRWLRGDTKEQLTSEQRQLLFIEKLADIHTRGTNNAIETKTDVSMISTHAMACLLFGNVKSSGTSGALSLTRR